MIEIMTGEGLLPTYITYANAQRKSGISRNHFRRLIRERGVNTYRVGKRVLLLRLDDVQALLEGSLVSNGQAG